MSDSMFGFDPQEAESLGSEGRYEKRIEKFRAKGLSFPRQRHYFWWIVHNFAAHGLLAIYPCRLTFRFHDWTSVRLNAGVANLEEYRRDQLRAMVGIKK